jgi:hypothetical protein
VLVGESPRIGRREIASCCLPGGFPSLGGAGTREPHRPVELILAEVRHALPDVLGSFPAPRSSPGTRLKPCRPSVQRERSHPGKSPDDLTASNRVEGGRGLRIAVVKRPDHPALSNIRLTLPVRGDCHDGAVLHSRAQGLDVVAPLSTSDKRDRCRRRRTDGLMRIVRVIRVPNRPRR